MSKHKTAAMAAPPGLTVHVRQASTRASSICVHRKRRSESPRADRLREGPSEVTPRHSVRVERRGGGFLGRTSFVVIHTRPKVAQEPSLEVYRAVREARGATIPTVGIRAGKGLKARAARDFYKHFENLAPEIPKNRSRAGACLSSRGPVSLLPPFD